ncbi:unnamed protein product [Dibothriocephalus latus]|uniref:Tyrosine-protein phosphatase domain-containing protein n=1 Tax=Dibothriocephalus latus TaxID=60516 RepID=A0A3P7NMG9_DIBLA|nr:unnamed protein product [Dibothriocephalus latus]
MDSRKRSKAETNKNYDSGDRNSSFLTYTHTWDANLCLNYDRSIPVSSFVSYMTSERMTNYKKLRLQYVHAVAGNYINASYIGSCSAALTGRTYRVESLAKPEFIITQDPLRETIGDFWQMVYEQQTPLIIMLSGCAAGGNEGSIDYWPTNVQEVWVFGSQQTEVSVQLMSERADHDWLENNFRVWLKGKENMPLTVRQLQFLNWPMGGHPNELQLVKFIEECYNPKVLVAKNAGPRVIHCR